MPEKKGLDLEVLKEVIKIMKENDLNEVCIEQNGLKIQVKQGQSQPIHSVYSVPIQTDNEKQITQAETKTPVETSVFIYSPMPGIFYESPKPGEKPYVKAGDSVIAGQVICIIEAMKLMNEIISDMDCEILEAFVKNGQTVEAEQPLFRVKPKA
ncbi:TPA: acetyl-CoA carboxylase, biotin carboxyl carrier protein [bacterium]|nr:acetyl-CoA carboxylase, biotin carboxyl carrier protein [bacterium]